MEEKNIKTEESVKTEKPTYEQLEQIALELQQRLVMLENKFKSIDFASMRVSWMFKVIENYQSFDSSFVNKCSKEIEEFLTIEDSQEKEEEKKND